MRGFLEIIERAKKEAAKSIFLFEGLPPILKADGLKSLNGRPLERRHLESFLEKNLTQWQKERFIAEKEIDYSIEVGSSRLRVNGFVRSGALGLVLRLIPEEVPSFDELLLPEFLKEFAKKRQGLFLVTGVTGSGKSTTLASLIELINRERACHIVTIEDPIEFVFKPKSSIISQREVGRDTKSFNEALKRVLREDPDVILVGEIRDRESMKVTIELAETGHLVFSTLHTRDAVQTLNRIIDFFPDEQKSAIYAQLANVLLGICSQRLIPRIDKKGYVCACEVLTVTDGVRNLIREGKIHQVPSLMESQKKEGMIKFDDSILELAKKGYIPIPEALEQAREEKVFIEKIREVRPTTSASYRKRGTLSIEKQNVLYQIDSSEMQFLDSSGFLMYTPLGLLFMEGQFYKAVDRNFIIDYSIIHGKKDGFTLKAFFSMEYLIKDVRVVKPGYSFGIFLTFSTSEQIEFPNPPLELILDEDWHSVTINIPRNFSGQVVRIVGVHFDSDIKQIFLRNMRFF
ncbi:MAG: PilT/PilU family type 4a pilus ATPase [Deltaproteobacteria bacterium]|nr:PilT/PilU family type 4a pilus ATPase [Deltaproteobacteria bacterium]